MSALTNTVVLIVVAASLAVAAALFVSNLRPVIAWLHDRRRKNRS